MEPKQKNKKRSRKDKKAAKVEAPPKEEPEVVQGEVTEATEGKNHIF